MIHTISAVDTTLWETKLGFDLRGALFNGASLGDEINFVTTDKAYDSADGGSTFTNPIEFRFGTNDIRQHAHIMKKVTVQNNESISLKFKVKSNGDDATLRKAQMFIQELSQ